MCVSCVAGTAQRAVSSTTGRSTSSSASTGRPPGYRPPQSLRYRPPCPPRLPMPRPPLPQRPPTSAHSTHSSNIRVLYKIRLVVRAALDICCSAITRTTTQHNTTTAQAIYSMCSKVNSHLSAGRAFTRRCHRFAHCVRYLPTLSTRLDSHDSDFRDALSHSALLYFCVLFLFFPFRSDPIRSIVAHSFDAAQYFISSLFFAVQIM